MKRLLLFIFLISISAHSENKQTHWSIVDIYQMAQQVAATNLNYPIYHQISNEDKWASVTTAWNTFIDATVDEKNSYIYILDEGTGGGSFSTQSAMWRDDTGGILLLVSENGYEFTFPERSFIKAFEYMPISGYSTSLGIRLVSPPMPKLSLLDFSIEDISVKDLRALNNVRSTIFYKLPRKGTSIHALLVLEDEIKNQSILKDCYYEKKICDEKQKTYRYYLKNLKGKIYRDIELKWQEYQFVIGKKSRKEPDIKDVWPESIKTTEKDL